MLNAFRLIIFNSGILMLILGGISWACATVWGAWASIETELPLGDLNGVAVDSSGNIYCCAQFYKRIQKYNAEGQFLSGYQIEGGAIRFRVNQLDQLEVSSARGFRFFLFSPEGKLIQKKVDRELYDEIGFQNERECRGPDGSLYQIGSAIFSPCIVKTLPSGEKNTLISVPLHLWFVMGPFPALLIWVGGILFVGLSQWKKKPEQKTAA